jgi:hypothetical protein
MARPKSVGEDLGKTNPEEDQGQGPIFQGLDFPGDFSDP